MKLFRKVLDPIFNTTRRLVVILLSLMVIIAFYEISVRTITGNTPSWSKELVLLAMVWMGCLGAAVLHRERGHITLELIVDRIKPEARKWILLAVDVLILAFSCLLTYGGGKLVLKFLHQSLPGTGIPVGISYLAIFITGLLLFAASLEHIFIGIRGEAGEAQEDAA